ncbi:MAG TPA: MarR family transcriptional regulator [Phycisphaerae bacterium]|nr:MarR family transcriptional regulator [Phycisphaerae bacterium]
MATDNPKSDSLAKMAEEIFALAKLSWRQRLASRKQGEEELTESQFLTLDTLHTAKGEPLSVGDIQRSIHVVPAQMSRIIRSLENDFDAPLIRCELNQIDKRKIDVRLTNQGRAAYEQFRQSRLGRTLEILTGLTEQDRVDFIRICRHMRELYEKATAEQAANE